MSTTSYFFSSPAISSSKTTRAPFWPRFLLLTFFSILVSLFFSGPAIAQSEPEVFPLTGMWNGFNNHLNVVECSNFSDSSRSLSLELQGSNGNNIDEIKFEIPSAGTVHLVLNELSIAEKYGVYHITEAGLKPEGISCHTAIYRPGMEGGDEAVSLAFSLPMLEPVSGNTGGLLNTTSLDQSSKPTFNWLTVYNPGSSNFSAIVEVYSSLAGTSPVRTLSLSLSELKPGERRDLALHKTAGQETGFYIVKPDVNEAPYTSFNTRYSPAGSFAIPLPTERGTCAEQTLNLSTTAGAENWVEFANPGNRKLSIKYSILDPAGEVLKDDTFAIEALSIKHIYLNDYLSPGSVGSFKFRCGGPTRSRPLAVASLVYGKGNLGIEWAYGTTTQRQISTGLEPKEFFLPLNTFLGAYNWLKLLGGTAASEVEILNCSAEGEEASSEQLAVRDSGALDHALMLERPDFTGASYGRSVLGGEILGQELLRVFPKTDGSIGTVMRVSALPVNFNSSKCSFSTDGGGSSSSSSSSSSGGSSSSSSSGGNTSGEVLSLSLYNADSDELVPGYQLFSAGSQIDFASVGTKNLSLVANVKAANVYKVDFSYPGQDPFRTEFVFPYSIAGDLAGDFVPWTPEFGSHTLHVRAFELTSGVQQIGETLVVDYSVVDSGLPDGDGGTTTTTTVSTTTTVTSSSSTTTVSVTTTSTTTSQPVTTVTTTTVTTTTASSTTITVTSTTTTTTTSLSTTTSSSTTTTTIRRPSGSAVLRVDPQNPRWFSRSDGQPFFLAGAGDPEDFFFRGSLNSNGTRSGDQVQLIEKLKTTSANAIYIQAIRSHGGDGQFNHNPFNAFNPENGFNSAVLDQWDSWLTRMDQAGIVAYFFIYDDGVEIWDTGDSVSTAERQMVEGLVNRFEHIGNLVWVVQEEYDKKLTPGRISNLARIIKNADSNNHPVAVHKENGISFSEFANDSNLDSFAVQYNSSDQDALNSAMVSAYNTASGRYNVTLAESAGHGSNVRSFLRTQTWAIAMANSYVLTYTWDIASTPIEHLRDLGHIREFFEATPFKTMSSSNSRARADTDYVLASPGHDYILYGNGSGTDILGVSDLPSGSYRLRWYSPVTNQYITNTVAHSGGTANFTAPSSFASEVVVHVDRL